jgi:Leucine-rich repeat (LRR) protein
MKKTNAKITYELPLKPSERLDLSRHALKVIPRDKKYEKYRRVDLSHNNIQTLSNIEQFDSLEELSLSANKIVDWH